MNDCTRHLVLVTLGSAMGGMARYGLTALFHRWLPHFPVGTIIINVTGSFVIGLISGLTSGSARSQPWIREFLMVGVCGGYTTFSSFSLQTMELMQEGRLGAAGLNIGLSVSLCLAAVLFGHWIGSRWR